jgi:hypothetical protein
LGDKYNELHADAEGKREERLLKRYALETERLKIIAPIMPAQISQVIAQEFGLNLIAEQREEAQDDAQETHDESECQAGRSLSRSL